MVGVAVLSFALASGTSGLPLLGLLTDSLKSSVVDPNIFGHAQTLFLFLQNYKIKTRTGT